jgi:hypothetical protein
MSRSGAPLRRFVSWLTIRVGLSVVGVVSATSIVAVDGGSAGRADVAENGEWSVLPDVLRMDVRAAGATVLSPVGN